jgi:NAD(P)-dependent dehydrogenase (short-subunit alcohol dehydrogenase family)
MDLNIKELRVLVTAGASGIGLEISRAFLREGALVHVCDIDADLLDGLRLAEPRLTRLFDEGLGALDGLDCLVNNAGVAGPTGRVEDIDPEAWDRCIAIDLTGHFNCIRLAVPHLKRSANASIVNLSSQAGRHGFPLRSPYAAAKWGVIGLTKTVAMELGDFGIRVNALLPGIVAGDRIRRVMEAKAQERGVSFQAVEAAMFANTSIKEYVTPQQLADMVVFLASPLARTVSGQAISVCGDTNRLI